ncbi:hypothetical protein QQZ08_010131 [Neonectria magnoliae]|uniref:Uncharacterized protein n=1 Tax=Neonectria magnoliae TaxID=2732573 RepID=A0ABR1HJD8_9HYPO
MSTNFEIDIPQLLTASPEMKVSDLLVSGSASQAGACSSTQSENAYTPVKVEPGTQAVATAPPDGIQSTSFDSLDRELRAAAQAISSCRQERRTLRRAADDESAARARLERCVADEQKKYEETLSDRHQLFDHYKTLYAQYENLKSHYLYVNADLQQANHKLEVLEHGKSQELKARDLRIEQLQSDILKKDAQLADLNEKLDSLEQQQSYFFAENIMDYEAEIENLKAENASAQAAIETLQSQQAATNESYVQDVLQLQQENSTLRHASDIAQPGTNLGANAPPSGEQTELEILCNKNKLMMRQLDTVREALMARFPNIAHDLGNITSLLAECSEGGKRKKRRGAK